MSPITDNPMSGPEYLVVSGSQPIGVQGGWESGSHVLSNRLKDHCRPFSADLQSVDRHHFVATPDQIGTAFSQIELR
jgi:hypothetical protein